MDILNEKFDKNNHNFRFNHWIETHLIWFYKPDFIESLAVINWSLKGSHYILENVVFTVLIIFLFVFGFYLFFYLILIFCKIFFTIIKTIGVLILK